MKLLKWIGLLIFTECFLYKGPEFWAELADGALQVLQID